MPWQPMSMDDQRSAFIDDYLADRWTMAELCARYGVSRKTGYKWAGRYDAHGRAGLHEQSRAPRTHPTAVPAAIVSAVLAVRHAHPHWGPRKIRRILQWKEPTTSWPAVSTLARVLQRAGVVTARRARRRRPEAPAGRVQPTRPNEVWTIDFKGWFRLQTGAYCYPLTVMDRWSRYVVGCTALPQPTTAGTRQALARVFATYGLPEVVRSDNGEPFAGVGLARLSRLSVWMLRLGIRLERTRCGKPQDNGAHERFHRTLKAETTRPPAASFAAQQHRFDHYRLEFNTVRPHEALGDDTPAMHYHPSSRVIPAPLPRPAYPGFYDVRRVTSNGCFKWHSRWVFVTFVLAGEDIGLEPIDDGLWTVHFAAQPIGRFDERGRTVSDTFEVAPAASAGPPG